MERSKKKESGFNLGVDELVNMSLDDLIKQRNNNNKNKNIKKNSSFRLPSKKAKIQGNISAASTRRQAIVNQRRGLNKNGFNNKDAEEARQKTIKSVMFRENQKEKKKNKFINKKKSIPLKKNVSNSSIMKNIKRKPSFTLPKGANMKITVNVNNVPRVVGSSIQKQNINNIIPKKPIIQRDTRSIVLQNNGIKKDKNLNDKKKSKIRLL